MKLKKSEDDLALNERRSEKMKYAEESQSEGACQTDASKPEVEEISGNNPKSTTKAKDERAEGYHFENLTEFLIYTQLCKSTGDVYWYSGNEYIDEYKKGYELFERGQFDKSIEVYQKCLELNPIGIRARFEICEAYLHLKDLTSAQKTLLEMKKMLVEEAQIARYYRRMGYIETERDNYEVAIACYRYSLKYQYHSSVGRELLYIASKCGSNQTVENPEDILRKAGILLMTKNSRSKANTEEIINKLDKLYKEIEQLASMMKYGYGQREIIEAAEGTGYTPREYREQLHNTYYQKQREYNRIIEQHDLIASRKKIIIDSFSDRESELSLLDPIEIDLGKRINSLSDSSGCKYLTETTEYRFYSCSYSMLREEKKTGNVVYFGDAGDPACVYHGKLYWFEFASILSDKYIYRRNVEDACEFEKLDWLSNEKTGEFNGISFHIVSEDRPVNMRVENNSLMITVKRKSIKNGKYVIEFNDNNGETHLAKRIISGDFTGSKDFASFS